jgi:formyltetrahydrofolate synthetase
MRILSLYGSAFRIAFVYEVASDVTGLLCVRAVSVNQKERLGKTVRGKLRDRMFMYIHNTKVEDHAPFYHRSRDQRKLFGGGAERIS